MPQGGELGVVSPADRLWCQKCWPARPGAAHQFHL